MAIPLESALLYDGLPFETDRQERRVNMHDESESSLVGRARNGDISAFEALVQRYRNDVFGLAYHFVRNREEAWDLSQEVFLKAYNGLHKFRGDSSFKTWLLRITANQCKDSFKKRRVNTTSLEDGQAAQAVSIRPSPRETLENRELAEAIDAAVSALPVKHRTAFILREFEGLSYDEMAQVMRCRLGTVMSRLHHARKRVQQHLTRAGFGEC